MASAGLPHQARELGRVHVRGDPEEVVDERRDGHADLAAIGLEHLDVDFVPGVDAERLAEGARERETGGGKAKWEVIGAEEAVQVHLLGEIPRIAVVRVR